MIQMLSYSESTMVFRSSYSDSAKAIQLSYSDSARVIRPSHSDSAIQTVDDLNVIMMNQASSSGLSAHTA